MSWYKTGTVSVTLNSNTVIGTGTAFIIGARVGDALRGPDGAWYEVTGIGSDVVLSISPNYQGATNVAGAYALAPMQGYVKESADALRMLVNTYGAKLAGLGSAASATLQSSPRDATPGRVMQVGAFGIGGDTPVYDGSIDDTASVPAGRCFVINTSPGVKPPYASYGLLDTIKIVGQPVHQTWHEVDGIATGGTKRSWERDQYGTGAFGAWRMVYRQNNIIGSVTGAGVPTGAIIERGANANGEYTKFADGTLVCWKFIATNSTGTYSVGALFGSDAYGPGAFPSLFAYVPTVTSGATRGTNSDCVFASAFIPPAINSWGAWRAMTTSNAAVAAQINLIAIGRWY